MFTVLSGCLRSLADSQGPGCSRYICGPVALMRNSDTLAPSGG